LRPRRAVHRRQQLEIFSDRRAILRTQLRDIPDHANHRATDAVTVRQLAGFEEIGDVGLAPVANSFLGDVRYPPLAFRIRSACKALHRHDAAEEIARTVTLRTMAEAVDEVSAAIPASRARGVRRERPIVHE